MQAVSDFINVFASDVSDLFTAAIRKRVSVRLSSITDLKSDEISDSLLTSPAVILKNDGISMAVVLERELAFIVLDTLLGGDGKGLFENRPFSDVEKAVLTSFADRLKDCINFAGFIAVEKNEYFSETGFIRNSEKLSVAELDVAWDSRWRKLYVCIPGSCEIVGSVNITVDMGASGISSDDASNIGIGFAVPVNEVAKFILVAKNEKKFNCNVRIGDGYIFGCMSRPTS